MLVFEITSHNVSPLSSSYGQAETPYYCQNMPLICRTEECSLHCYGESMTDGADAAITSNKEDETVAN